MVFTISRFFYFTRRYTLRSLHEVYLKMYIFNNIKEEN